MKKALLSALCFLMATGLARADLFGIGENQFEIEFVNISGDARPAKSRILYPLWQGISARKNLTYYCNKTYPCLHGETLS